MRRWRAAEEIVTRWAPDVSVEAFLPDWVILFEGLHRRAAFRGYADFFGVLVREALAFACRLHGVVVDADGGLRILTELQEQVEPFPDVPDALRRQKELGVKILVYSDVERRFLDLYLRRLPGFEPDLVGTTEEARIQKPPQRTAFKLLQNLPAASGLLRELLSTDG